MHRAAAIRAAPHAQYCTGTPGPWLPGAAGTMQNTDDPRQSAGAKKAEGSGCSFLVNKSMHIRGDRIDGATDIQSFLPEMAFIVNLAHAFDVGYCELDLTKF